MDVVRKDATITNTDDAFPGAFEVILSTGTRDRDGEEVLPSEWKMPLPEHITFDVDHGLSVAATVGSGTPRIDEKGQMIVSGTYSSLPRAQEVRTLVNEGHIKTTSVAFARGKTMKDGVAAVERELLNGSFVSIPANTEAVVLSSKTAVKAGRRNSSTDQVHLNEIARHAIALGADITGGDTEADDPDTAGKSLTVKDGTDADPTALICGIDAALDEAANLLATIDVATLPAEVQQAIALVQAAGATADELLDALGLQDPDEDADSGAPDTPASDAAGKAASDAGVKGAPVEDALIDQQVRAARMLSYLTLSEGI